MNNKKIIKNILKKSVTGLFVGVTILMITYAIVYFILGQIEFSNELNQLHNINTFLWQLILSGIAGFMLFIAFYAIYFVQDLNLENNFVIKYPYKSIFITTLSTLGTFLIIMIISASKIFSDNISTLITIMYLIIYSVLGLTLVIRDVAIKSTISKINQKLK